MSARMEGFSPKPSAIVCVLLGNILYLNDAYVNITSSHNESRLKQELNDIVSCIRKLTAFYSRDVSATLIAISNEGLCT